jgi:hypothetical protein
MESIPACTCCFLEIATDEAMVPTNTRRPRLPISRVEDGKYDLHLTAEQSVEVTACPICGGHQRDPGGCFTAGAPCACGSLAKWAADPHLPVRYDEQMNEYRTPGLLFYYCVACGGRLPESKRSSFFAKITDSDLKDFHQRTGELRTMEEVITLLGLPDFDFAPSAPTDLRRQINYANLWESLDAVFQEMADGTLRRFCYGKPNKVG